MAPKPRRVTKVLLRSCCVQCRPKGMFILCAQDTQASMMGGMVSSICERNQKAVRGRERISQSITNVWRMQLKSFQNYFKEIFLNFKCKICPIQYTILTSWKWMARRKTLKQSEGTKVCVHAYVCVHVCVLCVHMCTHVCTSVCVHVCVCFWVPGQPETLSLEKKQQFLKRCHCFCCIKYPFKVGGANNNKSNVCSRIKYFEYVFGICGAAWWIEIIVGYCAFWFC